VLLRIGREHKTLSHRQEARGGAAMPQYNPDMSGKRLKSGCVDGIIHVFPSENVQAPRPSGRPINTALP
jgi:hypothetical protein